MKSPREIVNKLKLFLFDADRKKKSWKAEFNAYKNAINALAEFCTQKDLSSIPTLDKNNIALRENDAEALKLKALFDRFGSDKANVHDYYLLYAGLLRNKQDINIFEMGLGTNHLEMISNMGPGGMPGASLRAFKAMYPFAKIYGADIDKRILFSEERITTFYADQLDTGSLQALHEQLSPLTFDLIIDDGLHTPEANINTLSFAVKLLAPAGHFVIEDIKETDIAFYILMKQSLQKDFKVEIYKTKAAYLCTVKKVG